ncbi:tetratricopeptide repeat protein [Asanoa ferruginea]|uniref:Tetratricopeptide repeat protein n=1 Tax=Asanoa ferruginea TaxID=53367 RepID=A0A3D9ZQB3_9ACTN|nr:tetratricopeptide repeat protein [Asanoa ferruginea]
MIVRLCGRLPLAVRIAGARLAARPQWSLDHLVRVLTDERQRLNGLVTGDLGVRASIASSYRALGGEVARLFRLLGTLDVPDFAGWVAAAVLDSSLDDGVAALEALVDAHLLAVTPATAPGQYRYRFHDLVRLYARERAEAEELPEERITSVSRALGAWLGMAEVMSDQTPGPCYAPIRGAAARLRVDPADVSDVDPVAWFDAECAALMRAVSQACALGLDELAYELAGCLERYFDLRGMYAEWSETNSRVLRLCEDTGNLRGQATMLRGLIEVRTWNNPEQDADAMAALLADATRLRDTFAAVGEERGVADALVLCSWAHTAKGGYDQARAAGTESLRLATSTGHLGGQARALVALALAAAETGQIAEAVGKLDQALVASRELGNPRHEATVLQFLGIAHCQIGNTDVSQRLLDAALAISRGCGDRYAEVLTMLALARLDLRRGDPSARAAAEAALAWGRHYNMRHHVADALSILGEISVAEGRPASAVPYLVESVAMWRKRGWLSFLASALVSLGLAFASSDQQAARAALTEAREIYTQLGDHPTALAVTRHVTGLRRARRTGTDG